MSNVEPKIKTDPEFEAMFKEAEAAHPNVPKFLLRVALHTALREEEAHAKKRLPKKKHIIDDGAEIDPEYDRKPPETLEYYGMEIIPPKDKENAVEIVEHVFEDPQEHGQDHDHAGQRVDIEGGREEHDHHAGAGICAAV
jgi:hypothetical protein